MTKLQITRSAHWMFPQHIHLFGLLPLSHQSLCSPPPPSCTSGEVGPLPFTLLCIQGMWHVTDQTHTHTEENNSPKAGPYSQCVNVQKRFFKASHKQYCCLNRTELLSGALWDVGGVMMWVMGEGWGGGLIQYFLTFMIHCYDLHLKTPLIHIISYIHISVTHINIANCTIFSVFDISALILLSYLLTCTQIPLALVVLAFSIHLLVRLMYRHSWS